MAYSRFTICRWQMVNRMPMTPNNVHLFLTDELLHLFPDPLTIQPIQLHQFALRQ